MRGAPGRGDWPFRRGPAIWPHSLSRARARVSGLPRQEAERGWRGAASLRARQRRAHPPARRAARSRPDPSCRRGSRPWRMGERKGLRPGRLGWDRVSFFSPSLFSPVYLTEAGELHLALPCCSCRLEKNLVSRGEAGDQTFQDELFFTWIVTFVAGGRLARRPMDDSRVEPRPCAWAAA